MPLVLDVTADELVYVDAAWQHERGPALWPLVIIVCAGGYTAQWYIFKVCPFGYMLIFR